MLRRITSDFLLSHLRNGEAPLAADRESLSVYYSPRADEVDRSVVAALRKRRTLFSNSLTFFLYSEEKVRSDRIESYDVRIVKDFRVQFFNERLFLKNVKIVKAEIVCRRNGFHSDVLIKKGFLSSISYAINRQKEKCFPLPDNKPIDVHP